MVAPTPQSPAPVAGDEDARPASDQPVEAIGVERDVVAWPEELTPEMEQVWRSAFISQGHLRRNHAGRLKHPESCERAAYRALRKFVAKIAALSPASPVRPELTVWYGKMPESNGRENWTAVLRRVNPTDKWDQGFCFARSEYPGRVLYEADRVRWIIGERAERPDILAYDADAHSGYVEPASPARTPMGGKVEALREAVEKIASEEEPELGNGNTNDLLARQFWTIATEALAAASPSPAQGGSDYTTLADLHTIKGWLHGLSTHPDLEDVVADGGVTAGMVYQQEAREFAGRIGRILAAPPSVQPVEGK